MKVAPPSADLLIKLALAAGGVALAWWAYQKAVGGAAKAVQTIHQAVDATVTAVNPASSDNLVNRGVTSIGSTLTGDNGFTVGGWLYDITHSNPLATAGTNSGGTPVIATDNAVTWLGNL